MYSSLRCSHMDTTENGNNVLQPRVVMQQVYTGNDAEVCDVITVWGTTENVFDYANATRKACCQYAHTYIA